MFVKNHKYFMEKAYKLAEEAYTQNEVPVGCVIVRNNEVISFGHNMTNQLSNPLAHAEVVAIKQGLNSGLITESDFKNHDKNLMCIQDSSYNVTDFYNIQFFSNNAIHNEEKTLLGEFRNKTINKKSNHLHFYVNLEPCGMCTEILHQFNCCYFYTCRNNIFGGNTVLKINNKNKGFFFDDEERSINLLKLFYKRENLNAPEDIRKCKGA
ncbi:hypothetical protein EDEG_02945 [Edhazardia aedis USNM 41457]|uniref:CMP/dCMP-type deaminase domain-containing protein n=1 Tax=Edhazardia aedis (strain USNM 41457) TaxID=1003232 RepID=J9DMU3_EDHAE|nr:hypothetical protein EDEG_02945 [Edhazardia aedis USNM 41457]|eukprot:EJW02662.1 hypothetical protein EDEG_02945 [Edhazardia aedis USNM 41457]